MNRFISHNIKKINSPDEMLKHIWMTKPGHVIKKSVKEFQSLILHLLISLMLLSQAYQKQSYGIFGDWPFPPKCSIYWHGGKVFDTFPFHNTLFCIFLFSTFPFFMQRYLLNFNPWRKGQNLDMEDWKCATIRNLKTYKVTQKCNSPPSCSCLHPLVKWIK